jgi:hypothetical protein
MKTSTTINLNTISCPKASFTLIILGHNKKSNSIAMLTKLQMNDISELWFLNIYLFLWLTEIDSVNYYEFKGNTSYINYNLYLLNNLFFLRFSSILDNDFESYNYQYIYKNLLV